MALPLFRNVGSYPPLLKSPRVKIENGVAGGNGWTSHRNAERYVAQGRARWTRPGQVIAFIESDYRHRAVVRAGDGYDVGTAGLAKDNELRAVPFVGSRRKLAALFYIKGR